MEYITPEKIEQLNPKLAREIVSSMAIAARNNLELTTLLEEFPQCPKAPNSQNWTDYVHQNSHEYKV